MKHTYTFERSRAVDAESVLLAAVSIKQTLVDVAAPMFSIHDPSITASNTAFWASLSAHIFTGWMAWSA